MATTRTTAEKTPSEGTSELAIDVLAVLVVVFVGGVGIYFWHGHHAVLAVMRANRGPVYTALAAGFGSLLGFAITAVSIVLTVAGNERLAELRKEPAYRTLWRVFFVTIKVLGVATLIAFLALTADKDVPGGATDPTGWALWLVYPVMVCLIASVILVRRCVWALQELVMAMNPAVVATAGETPPVVPQPPQVPGQDELAAEFAKQQEAAQARKAGKQS
jgi:hypothetical protein